MALFEEDSSRNSRLNINLNERIEEESEPSLSGFELTMEEKKQGVLMSFLNRKVMILFVVSALMPLLYGVLYVAAMWNPASHLGNLDIALVTADTGFPIDQSNLPDNVKEIIKEALKTLPANTAGEVLVDLILTNSASRTLFKWDTPILNRQQCLDAVTVGTYWGCLYIPEGFSASIFMAANSSSVAQIMQIIIAVMNGQPLPPSINQNTFQNPIEFMFDRGRNYGTVSIILTAIEKLTSTISLMMSKEILKVAAGGGLILQFINPFFVLQPFTLIETCIYDVPYYGMNFATYVFPVVLFIGSIMSVTIVQRYTAEEEAKMSKESWGIQILLTKGLIGLFYMGLQSLFVTLILVVPGAPIVHSWYNLFLWSYYYSYCFFLLNAFCCALLGIDLFQVLSTTLLILQLTTSSGILSEMLMFDFYRLGIVFPFYYAVRGNRYLIFGSYDTMNLNFTVIGTWIGACIVLIFIFGLKNIKSRFDAINKSDTAQLFKAIPRF